MHLKQWYSISLSLVGASERHARERDYREIKNATQLKNAVLGNEHCIFKVFKALIPTLLVV